MVRLPGYLIRASPVLILALLLLVSYSAGLAALIGFLLAWAVILNARRWGLGRWLTLLTMLVLVSLSLLVSYFVTPFAGIYYQAPQPPPIVKSYRVTIDAMEQDKFRVKEEVVYNLFERFCDSFSSYWFDRNPDRDPKGKSSCSKIHDRDTVLSLPERQITSTSRGLLLREANIAPLEASSGQVTITLRDGSTLHGSLCAFSCPQSAIELRDFPRSSFYAARHAQNVNIQPYIDTETITWSIDRLGRGITFAYIPSPYYHLRPILKPLLEVSSLSQWIIGVLGFLGSIGVSFIANLVRKKYRSRSMTAPKEEPGKTRTLIVSSSGDEKEIESIDER